MSKNALPGKRGNVFKIDPTELLIVGIDVEERDEDGALHPLADPSRISAIKAEMSAPRDANNPFENLVRNIMKLGVLQPVTARKNGDEVEIVVGRRRTLAAREACERLEEQGGVPILVTCQATRASDKVAAGMIVSENEIRQEDAFLSKARKAIRLKEVNGYEDEEIAEFFGVSEKQVSNWLKLGDLDAKVIKAIEKGEVTGSAAIELAPLERKEQVEALAALKEAGTTTTADLRHARQAKKAKKNGKAEVSKAPSKRAVTQMLRYHAALDEPVLEDDFLRGVRWVLGDLSTKSVAGLSGLLSEMAGGEG